MCVCVHAYASVRARVMFMFLCNMEVSGQAVSEIRVTSVWYLGLGWPVVFRGPVTRYNGRRAVDPFVPCVPVRRRAELPELAPFGVEGHAVGSLLRKRASPVDDAPARGRGRVGGGGGGGGGVGL
jgi:hypothetical protein